MHRAAETSESSRAKSMETAPRSLRHRPCPDPLTEPTRAARSGGGPTSLPTSHVRHGERWDLAIPRPARPRGALHGVGTGDARRSSRPDRSIGNGLPELFGSAKGHRPIPVGGHLPSTWLFIGPRMVCRHPFRTDQSPFSRWRHGNHAVRDRQAIHPPSQGHSKVVISARIRLGWPGSRPLNDPARRADCSLGIPRSP